MARFASASNSTASIIAVANLKGGTGKTTVAVNIAAALAGRTMVSVVDADAQGTATAYAEPGNLPIEVLPLPLDDERGAGRWIDRVPDSMPRRCAGC